MANLYCGTFGESDNVEALVFVLVIRESDMTDLQRLALRGREIQTRLAELGGKAEFTDDERSELDKLRNEFGDLNRRMSAIEIGADGAEVTESNTGDDQLTELIRRGNVGEMFDSIIAHAATDGANAELQEHYGIDGNQVPLAMLRRDEDVDDLHTRAVTPAPSNVGQNQASIIPYIFPQGAASYLGIAQPTVGAGEAVYPVLTNAPTVHTPAESASAGDTTGSFSAEVLSPARLQAAYFYSREDPGKVCRHGCGVKDGTLGRAVRRTGQADNCWHQRAAQWHCAAEPQRDHGNHV